ncbi:hypothetical protein [Nonomuraea sp. NPDC049400]
MLKANALPVTAGDVLRCESGGGGGYGPAERRSHRATAADLTQGMITG